ncbi:MAG: DUF58 domain-containing protein [Lentisphaeria bacterium]|jgi:uncharacterized protein (DUF58 family)
MPPTTPTIPEYMNLLDAAALAKVHRLEFIARGVMEGFVSGRHRSPARGFSVEFAEHREYAPGDDIRDLDWRAYGKSDRYYIKQYIEETNLRCTVLLDASGSMGYTGGLAARRHGQPLSKLDYGRYLAATLLHLLIHQQDAVGLVTFDSKVRRHLPARSRASHLRVLLEELQLTQAGEETALAPVIHGIAEQLHRRGLIVLISDLFDDPGAILNALHHFRFRKHEVILFHVMAEEEITFPFEGWSEFTDLEVAGNRVEINPKALRATYLDEVRTFVEKIKKGCGEMAVDYVPFSTKQDFDAALANYLANRGRMVGA